MVSRAPAAYENPRAGHQYDDLGYGVAIPAEHIMELLQSPNDHVRIDMSGVEFEDFP